jgi:hypothetical protein
VDLFITEDLQGGRLPQVIDRGEPAVLVCHWPGIYYNGEETGYNIFKDVVARLHARYDNLVWMKLSEISRYWAAKELTRIERAENAIALHAPFASPNFTLDVAGRSADVPRFVHNGQSRPLAEVPRALDLASGTFHRHAEGVTVCFDLPRGTSGITV